MKTNRNICLESFGVPRLLRRGWQAGFTFTELMVVLATLAILMVIFLPAMAGVQPRGKAFQCLNNMRQLSLAWTLYANENNERLAINSDPHVYNTSYYPRGSTSPSWVSGSLDWSAGQYNTNTTYLVNDKYSLLGGYLDRNYRVFACPLAAYYVSPPEAAYGWTHRARSVAMDAAVGDGYKYGTSGTPWGWNPWYVAKKTTDFNNPGPGLTWVFTDENPDSIDDGMAYTSCYPINSYTELPADSHDGGATMTFADGHVEIHKWNGPVLPTYSVTYSGYVQQVPCSTTDPDMVWLAQHTPAPQ
jgi:prepilin-type processing-associated H-X9-DG protein/prepilin-type N-terminal cleavage/methylation domain-containing protein